MPKLVFADSEGKIYDHPDLEMAAKSGDEIVKVKDEELIPLPYGSKLFIMSESQAVGWDESSEKFLFMERIKVGRKRVRCFAVSAFLAPAYTRTLLPATHYEGEPPILPLWAYTAIGWKDGKFCVAARRIDPSAKWDPDNYDDRGLAKRVKRRIESDPENRLIRQLARCAMEYHCFAAKNAFWGRWECPIPVSPVCNSNCVGCLSLQPDETCPSSHERIDFAPTADEIAKVAIPHLKNAEDPIVSFGQGCEGDPILQAKNLEEAIIKIRAETDGGRININTNGSRPKSVDKLCQAGLDSIRVSLNSPTEDLYNSYYRPRGYKFSEVVESIKTAKADNIFTSINLLVFPGVTDLESEVDNLMKLVDETGLDLIQMRNLSIDPNLYLKSLPPLNSRGKKVGMTNLIELLKRTFPKLQLGYFNRPR